MDAPCLRFCWSFFHLMALYQTWQLLSSAWCPAHLRFLCSMQWVWVLFWCCSELADSSNLHWNVNYWAVSQDVRARTAIAKWLSTFGWKVLVWLYEPPSLLWLAMFYGAPADPGMLPDESSFPHLELQRKEQNWAAPADLHECCGSGYSNKSG